MKRKAFSEKYDSDLKKPIVTFCLSVEILFLIKLEQTCLLDKVSTPIFESLSSILFTA